jgi:hypothetical protein
MSEIDINKVVQQLDELAVDICVLNLEYGFTSGFNVSRVTASMLNIAGMLDNIQKKIKEQQ